MFKYQTQNICRLIDIFISIVRQALKRLVLMKIQQITRENNINNLSTQRYTRYIFCASK